MRNAVKNIAVLVKRLSRETMRTPTNGYRATGELNLLGDAPK